MCVTWRLQRTHSFTHKRCIKHLNPPDPKSSQQTWGSKNRCAKAAGFHGKQSGDECSSRPSVTLIIDQMLQLVSLPALLSFRALQFPSSGSRCFTFRGAKTKEPSALSYRPPRKGAATSLQPQRPRHEDATNATCKFPFTHRTPEDWFMFLCDAQCALNPLIKSLQ